MTWELAEKKVYEALQWASSFLQKHDYESQIGERLLLHHTGWTRTKLFSEYQELLDSSVWVKFKKDVEKAASGVPVQHITGEEMFYGRSFLVNSDVLIPRPETEELIEAVLPQLKNLHAALGETGKPLQIVDVGTGSGIIAITLQLELARLCEVNAVDISIGALKVAKENASRLQAKVNFFQGDLLEPLMQAGKGFGEGRKMNAIISNPPYIPNGDRTFMKENVLDHEPELALFAGDDGLVIYRKLLQQIPRVLTMPGLIAFEIGHGQGSQVAALIRQKYGEHADIQVKNDINGKERIVLAMVK